MTALKPWYKVVTPREDLREGKPLDASEFAVHLDKVRDGTATDEYKKPRLFFERTFLTKTLLGLSAEVVRRFSGERTETNAVFNMTTQFGGGKTHALTLLYHLAKGGKEAAGWDGVSRILDKAGIKQVPEAEVAVFVGTEFDALTGRGGKDGTPLRKTPWGEIAFQLGGAEGFAVVAEHDKEIIEPKGDVIRQFLPKDKPCLILMDEIINYVSTYRSKKYHDKFYNFLQSLSETVRGLDNAVLLVSIPASDMEYTSEDEQDQNRFKKMLDRLGKAVVMSAETETSEIIRRRLFEWDTRAVNKEGRLLLHAEALEVCSAYADWVSDHRDQIPGWFADHAKEDFEATYPFHPSLLSVFERKWQELPRFQQTRGVLRTLALWVSQVYVGGYKKGQADYLIDTGSAPLEDPTFRAALFEQLGENKLEGAVTTDIAGKKESHAIRLDAEAVDTIKKARLHRKVATSIFFESNGGQGAKKQSATIPEIRLATSNPDLDIGNVETVLEELHDKCYYLNSEGNAYRFGLKENLNKRYADRRANVKADAIASRIKEEIQKAFPKIDGIDRTFFPDKSGQIPNLPIITLVILGLDHSMKEGVNVLKRIDKMTREYGNSSRSYKSALIWIVPESSEGLRDEARRLLAWQDIQEEDLKLDESQERQLRENIKRASRDLKESVWRTYKNVVLLGKDNTLQSTDLGLVTSSSSESMCSLVVNHLRQTGDIDKGVAPRYLARNWPGLTEWSTKAVRDAFFASPQFPRLLDGNTIKETISRGVEEGHLAYVAKKPGGGYDPFLYKNPCLPEEIEISDDTFIIQAEEAEKHIQPAELARIVISPETVQLKPGKKQTFSIQGYDQFGAPFSAGEIAWSATGGTIDDKGVFTAGDDEGSFLVTVECDGKKATASVAISATEEPAPPPTPPGKPKKLVWSGEIPAQKWSNFYMKVLTKLVSSGSVKIDVKFEANQEEGVSDQQVEETKAALRSLGLNDNVDSR